MAIIYTYPVKSSPANDDLILISDSADSNKTKQIKVSTLPGGSSAGVSSFNTLTGAVTITGGTNVTLNTVGNNIEINASSGGTPASPTNSVQFNNASAFGGSANLTFTGSGATPDTLAVTHTVDIKGDGTNAGKLKLYCENTTTPHAVTIEGPAHNNAAAYTLKLPSPAPSNQQILQSNGSGVLSWINTPSSGGGGSVDSVNTTDGTYINLTPNSATTGAVTVTADLSAVDGTSTTATKFLSKDNTWDVPSYTAAYTLPLATNGARGGIQIGATGLGAKEYAVQLSSEKAYVAVPWTDTTSIALTTTGTSGASTWNGTTLNIPQYSGGGSSASLGFTPLSIYEADDLTIASYTYYALLVCDVDVTLANAKVFVRSGTSAIYAALYSTTTGNMQTSSFTRLGTFSKTSGVATGINTLPVDGTVTLTAGQTIMLGFSSANQMAGGGAINSNALGVETTSLTTSFPASIADIENTTNASKRVAIHFYAS